MGINPTGVLVYAPVLHLFLAPLQGESLAWAYTYALD
jgi:hypothetical protein